MRILAPELRANVKCDDCRGRDVCPTSDYVGRDGKHEETVADIVKRLRKFAKDDGNRHVALDCRGLEESLDRIESAYRREMADFEATKRALADVIAEKKQFAEIAAKLEHEVAELRECLRLSTNGMSMVIQWLGKYPAWQEEFFKQCENNRNVLEGSAK